MPGALGPRFALEAGFLILLAVVLGFADLSPLLIILIMALAWVLVSLIEYFAWRQGPRFPTRYAAAAGPGLEQDQVVVEDVPAPPPAAPRAAAPRPQPAPAVEEETMVESAPPPADKPAAGSADESIKQADERVDAAKLAFEAEEQRTRHRLEPLKPRPRRRYGLFGPRVRPDESSSDEER
jgi:predicted lipid-binding transport protein (Tim44 family)